MKNRRAKRRLCILAGLLALAAAVGLTAHNLCEQDRGERQAVRLASAILDEMPALTPAADPGITPREWIALAAAAEPEGNAAELSVPDYILDPDTPLPVGEFLGVECVGILRVPSLGLELPVLAQWSYPALKTAPCLYAGSPYSDDLVIAAHNYSHHFGRIGSLYPGDTVEFADMDGNLFRYEVDLIETLQPTAVEEMVSGGWELTLFTCTVGGASRVTVRCVRAAS